MKASSSCYPTFQHICLGGKQWNTMQHHPVTKHHKTSPNSETLWNISKQLHTKQCLPRTSAALGTKMLKTKMKSKVDETASSAETCRDLDRIEQVFLASNQPQQAPGLSHSGPWLHWSLLARQRTIWGIVNFASGPWLPVYLLETVESSNHLSSGKMKETRCEIFISLFSLSKASTLSHCNVFLT